MTDQNVGLFVTSSNKITNGSESRDGDLRVGMTRYFKDGRNYTLLDYVGDCFLSSITDIRDSPDSIDKSFVFGSFFQNCANSWDHDQHVCEWRQWLSSAQVCNAPNSVSSELRIGVIVVYKHLANWLDSIILDNLIPEEIVVSCDITQSPDTLLFNLERVFAVLNDMDDDLYGSFV